MAEGRRCSGCDTSIRRADRAPAHYLGCARPGMHLFTPTLNCSVSADVQIKPACLQIRNDDTAVSLLMAISDLLSSSHAQHGSDRKAQLPVLEQQVAPALTQFAEDILARRSKSLQQQLGSTVRHRVNATLWLLVCIANMGSSVIPRLVRSLDMTSDTFSKLPHPPK